MKHYPIFDYQDIHSHVPGKDRVMSIDFSTFENVNIPKGQAITVGVHPWNADREIDWELFKSRLKDTDVVGIGEAGLDTLRGPSQEIQQAVFERQIELAEEFDLPLIIHSVRSNHKILELRKKYNPKVPWIIHGFRGNETEARQLTEAGIHLSLGHRSKPLDAGQFPDGMIHFESDEEPSGKDNI